MGDDASGGSGVVPEYGFGDASPQHTVSYLRPVIDRALPSIKGGGRALDLGCGNGANALWLKSLGWTVVGVDASKEGIAQARRSMPDQRFEACEISPDLCAELSEEPFDLVLSTEVVEHIYAPRSWAVCAFRALRPGGTLICSTPYHGYLKNVALAVTGRWDRHHDPLWDGGHIKFFSHSTLSALLREAGFEHIQFHGAGRLPFLWKSMVLVGVRPVHGQ